MPKGADASLLVDKPDRLQLSRRRMIKHKAEIRSLLDNARRISGRNITLFSQATALPQFAVLVPRRLGNAVRRNRMKRLAREVYRLHPDWFSGKRTIFMVKRYVHSYAALAQEIHQLVTRK